MNAGSLDRDADGVALRKESVDRNMGVGTTRDSLGVVALRKESVDRNWPVAILLISVKVALRKESVDRNLFVHAHIMCSPVALRKESVDRNISREISLMRPYGRSPQGERG